jgi:putative transposase
MKRFVHPLLLLLARATEKELVRMVEYLKAENRILRSRLPAHIETTPAERARLLKLGRRLGAKIKEVITIVHPRTFARWLKESQSGRKPRKRGRPRKPEEIRQLALEMAKASGWGYRPPGTSRHRVCVSDSTDASRRGIVPRTKRDSLL